MSTKSTNVKAHQRKNGSFVIGHIRNLISKFSSSENTQKSIFLTDATSQLVNQNSIDETNAKIHKNERFVSRVSGEDFSGHSWKNSSLVGAVFSYSNLNETIFEETDMGANFRMCSLNGAVVKKSDLSNAFFVECQMENADLSETVGFDSVTLYECDLSGANLTNVRIGPNSNISKCTFENANFSNADLRGSKIYEHNMIGANWKGARTEGMIVSKNEDPNRVKDELFVLESVLKEITDRKETLKYSHHSFWDAAEQMGLSKKQFEFLVSSGAIEIRDNKGERVKSQFDPEKHHVPAWVVQNFST